MTKQELIKAIRDKKEEINSAEWDLECTDDFDTDNARLMELDDEYTSLKKDLEEGRYE